LIIRGSKVMTLEGRLPPGRLPAAITWATPAAILGASVLSSRPWSVLMTALALLISPSQKNSSRRDVPGQGVDGLDGGDAMALSHQPAARLAAQRIGKQVAHEGGHHIERSAGMPLGMGLEVLGGQRRAVQVDAPRIGHVGDHAHGRAAEPVGRGHERIGIAGRQAPGQRLHADEGVGMMLDGAVAGLPLLAMRHRMLL
jgi:hypothetical protein